MAETKANNNTEQSGNTEEIQVAIVPRIRNMTPVEREKWARAIHIACKNPNNSNGFSGIPALRTAFAALMPFVDMFCDTAYTDCHYRVGIGPELLDDEKTTDEQLALVLLHETLHNTKRHFQRFQNNGVYGPAMNVPTDLEINSLLVSGCCGIDLKAPIPTEKTRGWNYLIGDFKEIDAATAGKANQANPNKKYEAGQRVWNGMLIPGVTPVFSEFPPHLSAEQYYSIIKQKQMEDEVEQIGLQGSPQGGASQGNGSQQDGGQQSNGQQSNNQSDARGNSGNDGTARGGSSTSTGSDGGNREYWVDGIDKSPDSDVWNEADKMGIHPISRAEENKVREKLAYDIKEFRRRGGYSSTGSYDAILDFVMESLRPPIADWRPILRRVSSRAMQEQTAGRYDYSYRRSNRRYASSKYIMPGMVAYKPRLRLAIDTSGSMSMDEYANVLSEAEGLFREMKATLEVVCVDTETHSEDGTGGVRNVSSVKEITLVGGGGTDMSVALKQVAEQRPNQRPDVLVIATDGIFNWDSFNKACAMQGLEKTALVMLLVSPEYAAYSEEIGGLAGHAAEVQRKIRRYKQDAYVVEAFVPSKK